MENITERVASSKTFLRERLDVAYRRLQYEPWYIKLSTLDRKLLVFILLAPIVLLIIIIVAVHSSSKEM